MVVVDLGGETRRDGIVQRKNDLKIACLGSEVRRIKRYLNKLCSVLESISVITAY